MISDEDRLLYMSNPEIHAAVEAVQDLARDYHRGIQAGKEYVGWALRDSLIAFFCRYERGRTERLTELQERLENALANSPITSSHLKRENA